MNLVTTIRQLVIGRLRWFVATGDERDAEILALRHQVLVLQRQVDRPRFTETDRTILAILSSAVARSRLHQVMLIVQPKTVIGWHRRLVARHWTYRHCCVGRKWDTTSALRQTLRVGKCTIRVYSTLDKSSIQRLAAARKVPRRRNATVPLE